METVKNKLQQHYASIFEVVEPKDLAVAEAKSTLQNLHHYEEVLAGFELEAQTKMVEKQKLILSVLSNEIHPTVIFFGFFICKLALNLLFHPL